jgi:hypothetical protein
MQTKHRQESNPPFLYCSSEEFEGRWKAKLLQVKIDKETKLMQECTFHPNVCVESLKLRTDPAAMAMRRHARLAKAQLEAEKDLTYHPKLNNPIQRRHPIPIHERLYSLAVARPGFETPQSEASLKPPSSIVTNGTKLYTEASERLSRQAHRLAENLQSTKLAATPKINPGTCQLLSSAVVKEAKAILGNPSTVSQASFASLMFQMGYSICVAPPSPAVVSAWHFLDKKSAGAIPTPAILDFLTDLHSNNSLASKFRELLDTRRNRRIVKNIIQACTEQKPKLSAKSVQIIGKLRKACTEEMQGLRPSQVLIEVRKRYVPADEGFVTPPSEEECTFHPVLIPRRIPEPPVTVRGFDKATDRLIRSRCTNR